MATGPPAGLFPIIPSMCKFHLLKACRPTILHHLYTAWPAVSLFPSIVVHGSIRLCSILTGITPSNPHPPPSASHSPPSGPPMWCSPLSDSCSLLQRSVLLLQGCLQPPDRTEHPLQAASALVGVDPNYSWSSGTDCTARIQSRSGGRGRTCRGTLQLIALIGWEGFFNKSDCNLEGSNKRQLQLVGQQCPLIAISELAISINCNKWANNFY